MAKFIKNFFQLFSTEEKKEMYWLLSAMLLLGFVEFVGVGSILPFMQVVASKEAIYENQILHRLFLLGQFSDERIYLLVLGICVLVLVIVNNVYIAFVNWKIFHFSWMRNATISTRLFSYYLYEKYEYFLNVNTADLEKNLFDEVRMVVIGILTPLLMIAKNSITIISVFILLLYIDPALAIATMLCLGGAYVLLFAMITRYLKKIGKIRADANTKRFKIADEALKGIKELNVLGRKQYFIDIFEKYSVIMSVSQANKSVVSKLPKHAFEVIAFGGILIIILYFLIRDYELSKVVPILSLYAFAGYRLMPALQTIFTGIAELRYTQAALDNLAIDLTTISETTPCKNNSGEAEQSFGETIEKIDIADLWYSYPEDSSYVLRGISISIDKNSTIGIIGTTGAGKTTLVDILLGLLEIEKGSLKVNGEALNEKNMANWRSRVGYVPQDIFLLDTTILENIAYGINKNEINVDAVIKAGKLAKIHTTIVESFTEGYDTIVGERGVKISGGQRQRIGIARALYHDPDVLIFDEGTSALDNMTEKELMDEIQSLSSEKTIIMIAHRLSTLKFCDKIFCLENGSVVDSGSYEEVSGRNKLFFELENNK